MPQMEVGDSTPTPMTVEAQTWALDAHPSAALGATYLPLRDVQVTEWSAFCPPAKTVLPPIATLFETSNRGMAARRNGTW